MELDRIVSRIPVSLMEEASEKLIDLVLDSGNAKKIPSGLTKTILYYWQRDQLKTSTGVQRLLEAALIAEPEKTFALLHVDLGIPEEIVKTCLA